jgi:molybdopterin synthase sulfur carrier subunit
MSVEVLYFASLRERAGREGERLAVPASLATLYAELRARHGFAFEPSQLRVAVNGALVGWDHAVAAGDEIAFIPPVSGG